VRVCKASTGIMESARAHLARERRSVWRRTYLSPLRHTAPCSTTPVWHDAMAKSAPAERLLTHLGDVDLRLAEGYFETPMGTSTAG
jgi:hypothetical protein